MVTAFGPFELSKRCVIGVINVTETQWVCYLIKRGTHTCYTLDPQQGSAKKMIKSLLEVVERLLHHEVGDCCTRL